MEYKDHLNNIIRLESTPSRIISLVPSQTELLHYLGLEDEVVGITKFCIHPDEWFISKPRVGGTKNASLEKITALQPDLIIGNKEENDFDNIKAIQENYAVWMSDICDLDDAYKMIEDVGVICDRELQASQLIDQIKEGFALLNTVSKKHKKCLYFIWNDPSLVAGKNTFIDDMLEKCGFENLMKGERYPEVINFEDYNPDFVLLSSEPYPFKEKHIEQFKKYYPNAKVVLVDGEMFSWYGSRLLHSPKYFIELLKSID